MSSLAQNEAKLDIVINLLNKIVYLLDAEEFCEPEDLPDRGLGWYYGNRVYDVGVPD